MHSLSPCIVSLLFAIFVAPVFACTESSPSQDQDTYCHVEESPDGTLSIVCPDSSATIESCYASLADLNGNGGADEGDCGLVGAAALMRQLCDSWEAWSTLPACRAQTTRVLTQSVGQRHPVAATFDPSDGTLVAAYTNGVALHYWRDDDRDLDSLGESVELPRPEPWTGVTNGPELEFTRAGCATVAFRDVARPTIVDFWVDRNCDKRLDLAEYSRLTFAQGELADVRLLNHRDLIDVVFTRYVGTREEVEVWRDLNGDGGISATELLGVASIGLGTTPTHHRHAATIPDSLRYETPDGRRWRWNIGATWTVASATNTEQLGRLASCEAVADISSSVIACDDSLVGRDGGVLTEQMPVRTVPRNIVTEYGGDDTLSSSWIVFNGLDHNQVSDVTFARFASWTSAVTTTAVREQAVLGLAYERSPLFFVRGDAGTGQGGVLSLEYWHPRSRTKFLGEECASGPDDCAGNLVCRASGNDAAVRCVPPML